jgi:hypothetical protein
MLTKILALERPCEVGGVCQCVAKGTETGFAVGNPAEGVQQVAGRTSKAVKARDCHHVARFDLVEQAAKLGAVGLPERNGELGEIN